MHKSIIRSNGLRQLWLGGVGAALTAAFTFADAAAPAAAPQVLLAITNSESMDGTTSGAIMVGSGSLSSGYSSLTNSSSPTNFTVPSGFTPPLKAGTGGLAPYTVAGPVTSAPYSCPSGDQCDNGPSRLNMTKAAITSVLSSYGSTLNFGLYTYKTSSLGLYNTWVYYMSPSTGPFGFTNTAAAAGATPRTVTNPCYNYGSSSSQVNSSCSSIAGQYGGGAVSGNQFMTIGASSDDPLINDVLYVSGSVQADFLTYGGASPANPYTYYSLNTYNTSPGSYSEKYNSTAPNIGAWATTPTNAGYVPFSNQVLYSQRGFGYGASQSATTGTALVAMSTDPTSSAFTNALQPETNDTGSGEIKASAGQSAIYALMNGAKSYLAGLTKAATCQTQFVVLLTDGLPTMDKSGNAWPPLGTTTAAAYSLTATYNADGSFASSNSQAVTDAITAITALNTAGIKTFVIGLGAGVDPSNNAAAAALLKAMAIAGGTTTAYAATDTASLNAAFLTVVDIIYKSSAVEAPVAPISVADGKSFEYELTSISTPASGHVQAYAVTAAGDPSSTASWDAGDSTHMSTATRKTALQAANASGSIVALGSVDAAAFGLTATTCVPNTTTIVNYTVDPSYSGGPSGCSYLAGRQSGWPLGVFDTQSTGHFMGPPSSGALATSFSTYAAFATSEATRTPSVLFTNTDGFLYSVNSSTGLLQWGWTTRNILPKLQNYATFASSGAMDGSFIVADAMNSGGSWATYIVGSLQSGAEHFSLALDSSGAPASVVYDDVIASGTSAGDLAGATGSTPLRQPTVTTTIGNVTYVVYVVTVGSTSTLYERDITATTASASAALPSGFKVSSAISLDPASNQLWLGGTDGTVRFLQLTGVPATDVASLTKIGTTVTPSSGATLANVLYVSYLEVDGIPYIYAANSAEVTVFGIGSTGWAPLWATTPTQGYKYSSGAFVASSTVTTMTGSSIVSDIPIQTGPGLLVPVYVAGTACTVGTGDYDFFNLADGTFPNTGLTYKGAPITSDFYVGAGVAFSPSITADSGGIQFNPGGGGGGTSGGGGPSTSFKQGGGTASKAVSWTQH